MLTRALLVVLLLLSLLATATTASPVRVRAMEGGAMAPTIDPGDAYVLVDAGTVRTGDVVVFWSPEHGTFLVRRIVERTDAGYVTRGDGLDATDQAAGLSPVPRSGVVGTVPEVAGELAVLSRLGGPVSFVERHAIAVLALFALAFAGFLARGRRDYQRGRPRRSVWRVRDVVGALFIVALVASVSMTPLGAATYQVTFLATQDGGDSQYAVPVGEEVSTTLDVPVRRPLFSRLVVDAEGMTVDGWTVSGSTLSVGVTIPPATATGPRPTVLRVYPYPAVLPRPALEALHALHPIVAVAGSAIALLGLPALLYALFVDGDRPIDVRRAPRRLVRILRERR